MTAVLAHAAHDHGLNAALIAMIAVVLVLAVAGLTAAVRHVRAARRSPARTRQEGSR